MRLGDRLQILVENWRALGLPSHSELLALADQIATEVPGSADGLWAPHRPLLLTATMDDGIGQGLQIVERYARLVGMRVQALGLNCSVNEIVMASQKASPQMIGLTVLQWDTLEEITALRRVLPETVALVIGGPIFRRHPLVALKSGVDAVAGGIGEFVEYLLNWSPP